MPDSPKSPQPLRAQVTSRNGEISCSVEETNRIRKALGLKPLQTNPPPPAASRPTTRGVTPQALRERVSRARRARQTRDHSVAVRSIAEDAFNDGSSDEESEEDVLTWVKASRAREKTGQASANVEKPRGNGKGNASVGSPPSKAIGSSKPVFPEDVPAENATLVLADAPVIDGSDVLEDMSKTKKRERSPEIDGANYDGTDAAEFGRKGESERGGFSAVLGAMEVENDYGVDTAAEKIFAKRKRERKAFKKRKRVADAGVVKTGRMEELRKFEKEQMAFESSDDDALYKSLTKARKTAKQTEVKHSVNTILQAINRANEADEDDGAMEDAERIVYGEMEQFLQKLPTANAESDSDEDMTDGSKREAAGKDVENRENVPNEVAKDLERNDVDAQSDGAGSTLTAEALPGQHGNLSEVADDAVQTGNEALGEQAGRGGQSGVAAFLARLRSTGDLNAKHEQRGRARDKRFSDDEETSDRKRKDDPEIKLRYTDERGNELTRKEAFRLLCHKFHGNGPGQNKREKRLRKMLENIKSRNMHLDDTPLASAAALKEETRRIGSAHVVLSGSQALQKNDSK